MLAARLVATRGFYSRYVLTAEVILYQELGH